MYFYYPLNIPSSRIFYNIIVIVCLLEKKNNKNLAFWAETMQKANKDLHDTMNEIFSYYQSGESIVIDALIAFVSLNFYPSQQRTLIGGGL